jgi:transcriptional regulator with XRE-family HTH domain
VENFQLGTFLKKYREDQRLSTRDLAERTQANKGHRSVTAAQINKIENNKSNPEFQTLQSIASALNLPLTIIFDGGNIPPDTVTILSTKEALQSLDQALRRRELLELLLFCQELTDEQVEAILGVARSIRAFTRSIDQPEETS